MKTMLIEITPRDGLPFLEGPGADGTQIRIEAGSSAKVPRNTFWLRRVLDGDAVEIKKPRQKIKAPREEAE